MPEAASLDKDDSLARFSAGFCLPEGMVYLDGNSLGASSTAVIDAVNAVLTEQWGADLISSWNKHDWIGMPVSVGERIAPLLGAAEGQVVSVDSISVNIFKLLNTALALRPGRLDIIAVEDDFPSDAYVAQGLAALLGAGRCRLRLVAQTQLEQALDSKTAVVMLSHVNYRSGERYDMQRLSAAAHDSGALILWDLAHSAGVMPLDLDAHHVDMAVGCGYKYLNGGPGAPGFVYLNRRHHGRVTQPLWGWLGHSEPFAFKTGYRGAEGVAQFQVGTPAVLSMAALNAALDVYGEASMKAIRTKSLALTAFALERMDALGILNEMTCITPSTPNSRGSQLSLVHPQAWGISQALIEANIIVDFRAPDVLRLGFAPLYNSFGDVEITAMTLADIVRDQRYLSVRFQQRPKVT
ncbi:MAG: kynureninase [Congregibacter sp.]